ncbi:uncharacterized protein [Physcomitrium patens]|uniref:uncharacterized protein isoform X2 n=1 Tax=Physcomitrium patens TaxID=3218 RepID=UPI000D172A1E|nr:CRAL-TRIO domain-containing protein C23B6.04c-like isoform X2 [Physcomitrium patens]|eukprot:XP_024381033.1 CRAL-TRIO domain-containing protein C23B6.04c-like isoform X2 [Physcomitrella patens]
MGRQSKRQRLCLNCHHHPASGVPEDESQDAVPSSQSPAHAIPVVKGHLAKQISNNEFVDAPTDLEMAATVNGPTNGKDAELPRVDNQQEEHRGPTEFVDASSVLETPTAIDGPANDKKVEHSNFESQQEGQVNTPELVNALTVSETPAAVDGPANVKEVELPNAESQQGGQSSTAELVDAPSVSEAPTAVFVSASEKDVELSITKSQQGQVNTPELVNSPTVVETLASVSEPVKDKETENVTTPVETTDEPAEYKETELATPVGNPEPEESPPLKPVAGSAVFSEEQDQDALTTEVVQKSLESSSSTKEMTSSVGETSQAHNPSQPEVPALTKTVAEVIAAPILATEGNSEIYESSQVKSDEEAITKLNEDVVALQKEDFTRKSLPEPSVVPANGSLDAVLKNADDAKPTLEDSNQGVVGTQITEESAKEIVEKQETVAGKVDELKVLEEMRAKIAEVDPKSKDTDEATLRRFLRARSWKLSKAVKMFVDHQKWRRSFLPLGYIPQEEIKNELDAEKVFLQGSDIKGRPIVVLMAAKHEASKRNFDEFKRFCVFSFDTLVGSMKPGNETFTVILDLKGLAFKNVDVRGWISIFDFLQAYYPERLGRLFIIHVPKVFWGAWKLVYPFIDKVTREKIAFVEDKQLESRLRDEIEQDQIPDIYGGALALVPIQKVAGAHQPPKAADHVQTS